MTPLAIKSPPKDTGTSPRPAVVTTPPSAKEYRQILIDARKNQLALSRENLQRLAKVYNDAADSIVKKVAALPDDRRGTIWFQAQLQLRLDIDNELARLARDYGDLLDLSMGALAEAAVEREKTVAGLVNAKADPRMAASLEHSITLSDATQVSIRLSPLAKSAVETAANRYYRDGLQLSQRLHNLNEATRKAVEDTVTEGIAKGTSARNLSKELQVVMSASGTETPTYQAMRIARTEINNIHREAHVQSTLDPTSGRLKDYIQAVGWRLSQGHKNFDICDLWADHDSGLGPGNYEPDDVPVDHAHGLCFTITVLKEIPDVSLPGKRPNVDEVRESMVRHYAEKVGDPVAAARWKVLGERAQGSAI